MTQLELEVLTRTVLRTALGRLTRAVEIECPDHVNGQALTADEAKRVLARAQSLPHPSKEVLCETAARIAKEITT